jgi:hypothetical protein
MLGFNGGLIGKERRLTSGRLAATGLWLPNEQSIAKGGNNWPFGPVEVPNIGDPFLGGFFAGYISHTADGVPTHALIVAPAATGASGAGYPITTALNWRTSQLSTPDTLSDFDGRANTDAMITAGIGLHPAANFCVGLSIGGFADWYLPARFELDIAYENLKPTTDANNTSWGINDYSVPKRTANRTADTPPQTSVVDFKSGESEAFINADHWASTEFSSANGWQLVFNQGTQGNVSKTNNFRRTRAFRRVPV